MREKKSSINVPFEVSRARLFAWLGGASRLGNLLVGKEFHKDYRARVLKSRGVDRKMLSRNGYGPQELIDKNFTMSDLYSLGYNDMEDLTRHVNTYGYVYNAGGGGGGKFGITGSDRVPLSKSRRFVIIVGLVGGIFFLSSNVTGNAISNLSNTTSSWIGGVLILIGVVALGFWIKNRKNKVVSVKVSKKKK